MSYASAAQAQPSRCAWAAEPFVASPQRRAAVERGGEKVYVGGANAAADQFFPVDEREENRRFGHGERWQAGKHRQRPRTLRQVANRKLLDDQPVRRDFAGGDELSQRWFRRPEMVDPDGCVREDQKGGRRRGGA